MQQDKHAAISTIATKHDKPFDRIVILSNAWDEQWDKYTKWLTKRMATIGRPAQDIGIRRASIESPIHYKSITSVTERWLTKLASESDELYINLTSGTPAMATVSVLLGTAKANTYFLQVSPDNKLFPADIPVDFGKEYVRSVAKTVAVEASKEPCTRKAFDKITSKSVVMKKVITQAKRLAESELPALILGETGTGKELMANAIHAASMRADQPIKIVNCGALPETLVDSTLFGHVKGAFTGAGKDHKGLFELADGGTLFLDEVGELSPDAQVKLLRAIQQGEITKVGDESTTSVDVRVIAATHRKLNACKGSTKVSSEKTFFIV